MRLALYRPHPLGILAAVFIAAVACASTGGGSGDGSGGVCTSSCPKSCNTDADCPSAEPICASYGSSGSACVPAGTVTPIFCSSDSTCNTSAGEACCMTNPNSTETVCAPADQCRVTCAADSDCAGGTPKCCADFSTPVCTATEACPVACATSASCNTAAGQLCCTTIHLADPNGILSSSIAGACTPASECPVACTQDSDCTSSAGGQELCCNGLCASTCAKTCSADSDCDTQDGQLCCTNPVISSPWFGYTTTIVVGGAECALLSQCCSQLSSNTECLQIVAQGNETTCEALYEDECQNIITIPDGGSSDGSIFIGPDSSGIDSGQCNVSCFQDSDCQDSCVAPGTDTYCCDTSTDTCFVALACGDGIDSGTGVDSGFDSGGLDSGSCIDSGLACGLAPCCSGECEGDICQ